MVNRLRQSDLFALLLLFLGALSFRIRFRYLAVLLLIVSVIVYVAGRHSTSETET